jgi:hypothetical protein
MTGYKGRIGIYELLLFDNSIRSLVRDNASPDQLRTVAQRAGMRLMHEYALDHVCAGLTTLDEVLRVVPFEHLKTRSCSNCRRELAASFAFCPFCGQACTLEMKPRQLQPFIAGKVANE